MNQMNSNPDAGANNGPGAGMGQMTAHHIQQLIQHRQAQQMMQQQESPHGINEGVIGDRGIIINFGRDGSTTRNQLTCWFSAELLAQANVGIIPLLNSGQSLSLEEFECSMQHSSAAHNYSTQVIA